jgi:hypothetical protein
MLTVRDFELIRRKSLCDVVHEKWLHWVRRVRVHDAGIIDRLGWCPHGLRFSGSSRQGILRFDDLQRARLAYQRPSEFAARMIQRRVFEIRDDVVGPRNRRYERFEYGRREERPCVTHRSEVCVR